MMTRPIPSFPPFTPSLLSALSRTLRPATPPPLTALPPHTAAYSRTPAEAAVLIPLMNIGGEPHVLMEVRAKKMRVHAGEASFPGGKVDSTDPDLIDAALREAQEELALPPSNVEILGMLDPEYALGNRSRVWPFVGFIHSTPPPFTSVPGPLPSLPTYAFTLSPEEVSALLFLPLAALATPSLRRTHYFRLDPFKPYHKILADEYVITPEGVDEGGEEGLEVWGLSGWFLNKLAERAGWMEMPKVEGPPED
ncbi:hypothetical protein IAT38_005435 [Cryptococcus sp. DSM 104549]